MYRILASTLITVTAAFAAASVGAQEKESGSGAGKTSGGMTISSWRAALKQTEPIRVKLVRDAAMSAAMRAGLANQSLVINKILDRNARFLDDIYDFSSLMLENNVVPPVIRRVERITEHEGDVLRYSAVRFRIVKQAAFSTRAPSWRQYLMVPIWDDLGRTHSSLMPQNSEEREAASEGLDQGWKAGSKQANDMFLKGLTRLDNEFLGMLTYHALLKSNMVTLPKVLRKDVPIVGDGSSMTLDQRTYTIENRPIFNPQMMSWVALIEDSTTSSLFGNDLAEKERDKLNMAAPTFDELSKAWLRK